MTKTEALRALVSASQAISHRIEDAIQSGDQAQEEHYKTARNTLVELAKAISTDQPLTNF